MDLITIAAFPTNAEATLAKDLLVRSGIAAVVADDATGDMWHLTQPFGEVKVQVPSDRAEKARELLDQAHSHHGPHGFHEEE